MEEIFWVLVWVNLGVVSTVDVTSVVSEPDIVTEFNKLKGWREPVINDPCGGIGEETVLKHYWWLG